MSLADHCFFSQSAAWDQSRPAINVSRFSTVGAMLSGVAVETEEFDDRPAA
jgi:hypothetical protein